jgi:NAD(P)-dependent dehydrogenase (short-subunit alcohol dehydrogenase family)
MHEAYGNGSHLLQCGRIDGHPIGDTMAQRAKSAATDSGLRNKRIIILGGSSGIGLAVAQQASAQGAQVVIASSSTERVQEAALAVGCIAEGRTVDLFDERAIQDFFAKLDEFDHLIFTAGDTLQLGEIAAINLEQARRAFDLRYWAALAAVKYGSPHMRPGGSIVLTTGVAGRRPHKGWALGASVTSAVEGLTRALAVELAPLRVNAVSPGVVRTNLWRNMTEKERDAMYQNIGESLLVGRVGETEDIAHAYLYLMQERYSTGQVIVVDGGATLV